MQKEKILKTREDGYVMYRNEAVVALVHDQVKGGNILYVYI